MYSPCICDIHPMKDYKKKNMTNSSKTYATQTRNSKSCTLLTLEMATEMACPILAI